MKLSHPFIFLQCTNILSQCPSLIQQAKYTISLVNKPQKKLYYTTGTSWGGREVQNSFGFAKHHIQFSATYIYSQAGLHDIPWHRRVGGLGQCLNNLHQNPHRGDWKLDKTGCESKSKSSSWSLNGGSGAIHQDSSVSVHKLAVQTLPSYCCNNCNYCKYCNYCNNCNNGNNCNHCNYC